MTIDIKTAAGNIGKRVVIDRDGMQVEVEIINLKVAYGTLKYEVKPISGTGSQWVNADKVETNRPT